MGDAAILCGQATTEQGHGMPIFAALTQDRRELEPGTSTTSPRVQITGGTPRPWQTTFQDSNYLTSTASLRPSPREGRSPRERVVPPHLAHHHFYFGEVPAQPGHGTIQLPSELVSDVPVPLWGRRSTEVSRRNLFGPTPGERSAAEFELREEMRAAARASRSLDAAAAHPMEPPDIVTVVSSRASSPSRTSRLGTPAPLQRGQRGDVHARLVASSRIRAYQQEHGRLREVPCLRKPGFVHASALGVPTPRTWRVGGVPTEYSSRIPPPPCEPPASTSIIDAFK